MPALAGRTVPLDSVQSVPPRGMSCNDGRMSEPRDAVPLQSVDRALQLTLLLREGRHLSVQEAAEALGTAASTAHRLLSALVQRGFAVQDRKRRYAAGPVLVPQGAQVHTGLLRRLAFPVLQGLHQRVGETVQMMVLKGPNILFIDGIEDVGRSLRVGMRLGVEMPAYCSAGGKALLAEMTNVDIEQVYRGGLTPWPTARFTSLTALKRHLATVRRLGYGTNLEETERGVHGVGVSVHAPSGSKVAALTIALPSVRFRRQDLPRYVDSLATAKSDLEDSIVEAVPART